MNPCLLSKAAAPARAALAQSHLCTSKIQCLSKGAQLHTAALRIGSRDRSSFKRDTRVPSTKRVSNSCQWISPAFLILCK